MKILKNKVLGTSQEQKTILKIILKRFLESFESNLDHQDDKETAEFVGEVSTSTIVTEEEDEEETTNIS